MKPLMDIQPDPVFQYWTLFNWLGYLVVLPDPFQEMGARRNSTIRLSRRFTAILSKFKMQP